MSDMFDALVGDQPVDSAALASGLRKKEVLGTIAALTGINGLQKLGPQMINQAASGAQDYATLRDRNQNNMLQRAIALQGEQDRKAQATASLAQAATLAQQHDDTMRAIGAGHDKARTSAGSGYGALTDDEAAALRDATAAGKINPDKVNSRNIKYLAGMALNRPDADLNQLAQEGAQMRNVQTVNKAQTLEQMPIILKAVADAGSALNFSDNRLMGSIQALGKKYTNDPQYTKYMALRNDSLMSIAGAMRQQGMSDFATKLEDEAQHPTQSPRALAGWLEGQMAALGPKLAQAHKILHNAPPATAPAAAPAAPSAALTYDPATGTFK